VNDFSISLDSCCAANGHKIAGCDNIWDTIVCNIEALSGITYVTVGVVANKQNCGELDELIAFASNLGVADIRVIPAAQDGKELRELKVDAKLLEKHPILKYRFNNFVSGKPIRGLSATDNKQCPLVLDDMAIFDKKHYPCIIYLRERGEAIGSIDDDIRAQRQEWFKTHDCFTDTICKNNCLDVCVDHNNRISMLNKEL
jgi:MoaA/NifB/PqqE/SkfB family radical SAM enzyme